MSWPAARFRLSEPTTFAAMGTSGGTGRPASSRLRHLILERLDRVDPGGELAQGRQHERVLQQPPGGDRSPRRRIGP